MTAIDPTGSGQHPGFDVIGDVHGHADELEALLTVLGYTASAQPDHPRQQPLWRHPTRQAIFVGDLIDRGPAQVRTVDLVREMVDAGAARMVLGNHEFNAIAWAIPNPEVPGEHLRPHLGDLGRSNRRQHASYLEQVGEGSDLHREHIAWFMSLPLWLELDGLRVVHACWDSASMRIVERMASHDGSLTHHLMVEGSRAGSAEYRAIETVLKGPELSLPASHHYLDKDGHLRSRARVRWWDPEATTLRAIAEIPRAALGADGTELGELPDGEIGGPLAPYTDPVPVVFGHYWRGASTAICTPTTACVDHSVAKGGPLAAYRWNVGDDRLDGDRFVFHDGTQDLSRHRHRSASTFQSLIAHQRRAGTPSPLPI